MEISPSRNPSRINVINIDPTENILTALPYRPHSSLLDFLKGEPKVLGVIQILLSLIILGLGIILSLSCIYFSKIFPLVILTGYPYWGAFIFCLTGLGTVLKKPKILRRYFVTMNILSCLAAISGMVLIIISFRQQHMFCQIMYAQGTCVVGRTLLLGILSVLLIITIAEFSISVTTAVFRSKSWTSSNEVVFFLPSDATQNSEQAVPEDTQLKFEFLERSSEDDQTSAFPTVFFGGYAFFKLRVLKSPLAPSSVLETSDKGISSLPAPDEQETISPSFKPEEKKTEPNPSPPTLEPRSPENTMTHQESTAEQLDDRDLETSEILDKLLENQLRVTLVPSTENLLTLLPEDFSSQSLLQSKPPSSLYLTSEDMPPLGTASQENTSPDNTSQNTPYQDIPSLDELTEGTASKDVLPVDKQLDDTLTEDISFQDAPSQYTSNQDISEDIPYQETPTKDMPSQDTLSHNISHKDMLIQDIPEDTLLQDVQLEELQTRDMPSQRTPSQRTPSQRTPSQRTPSQRIPSQWTLSQPIPPQPTLPQPTPSHHTPSQYILSQHTPSQHTPSQHTPSRHTPSRHTPSRHTPSRRTPSRHTPSQHTPSQHTLSQHTPSQHTPSQHTLSQHTPSQHKPSQDTPSQDTSSQYTPSQDTTSQYTSTQDTSIQDAPSQDTSSQHTQSQYTLSQETLTQEKTSENSPTEDMSHTDLQSPDTHLQRQESSEIIYQDIRTEVMELTQEWTPSEAQLSKNAPRRRSFGLKRKGRQSTPKRHSLPLPSKHEQPPRRPSLDLQRTSSRQKSLDQQIKSWFSPKKPIIVMQDEYTQTSAHLLDKLVEDQKIKEKEPANQQPQEVRSKDQLAIEEHPPEEQLEDRQANEEHPPEEQLEDRQANEEQPLEEQPQDQLAKGTQTQEEPAPKEQPLNWQDERASALAKKTPKQLGGPWDFQGSEDQDLQLSKEPPPHWTAPSGHLAGQRSQDRRTQGWRNKDWKGQERQSSLKRGSQELLEREAQRQRALYQRAQTQTVQHLQLQNPLFQVTPREDKDQRDLGPKNITEDTTEREPGDTGTGQQLKDQQSENVRPDDLSSNQSLVPYTYLTCLASTDSEQEEQQNTSGCSTSSKGMNTSYSSYQRSQQQSEDSD